MGFLPISAAASIFLYRHTSSGQSRVYRVAQLRTDGVHCLESAGTRPFVLKVVPVTGAAFSGITIDQLVYTSLFPHPLILVYYVVDMWCDTKKSIGGVDDTVIVIVYIAKSGRKERNP